MPGGSGGSDDTTFNIFFVEDLPLESRCWDFCRIWPKLLPKGATKSDEIYRVYDFGVPPKCVFTIENCDFGTSFGMLGSNVFRKVFTNVLLMFLLMFY